jgi:palmitoyltransferase ZDHHC9/14/18
MPRQVELGEVHPEGVSHVEDEVSAAVGAAAADAPRSTKEADAACCEDAGNLAVSDECHCCLRVGSNWLVCGRKRSRWPLQIFVGPDWPCMCCTYGLLVIPTALFLVLVAPRIHAAVVVVGCLSLAVLLGAFTTTACSDPGVVYRGATYADGANLRFCGRCAMDRPLEARHCYDCELCVEGHDHHCPWTGKCIGGRTIAFFYAFLIALVSHVCLVVVLTLYFLLH